MFPESHPTVENLSFSCHFKPNRSCQVPHASYSRGKMPRSCQVCHLKCHSQYRYLHFKWQEFDRGRGMSFQLHFGTWHCWSHHLKCHEFAKFSTVGCDSAGQFAESWRISRRWRRMRRRRLWRHSGAAARAGVSPPALRPRKSDRDDRKRADRVTIWRRHRKRRVALNIFHESNLRVLFCQRFQIRKCSSKWC